MSDDTFEVDEQPWISEVGRRIWDAADEAAANDESWPDFPGRIMRGYLSAIEHDAENVSLRCEAAASIEFLRWMLRTVAVSMLREALEKEPEHAEALSLLDGFRSEVTLSTRAAYREAGQAVAEVLLGRRLVRVTRDGERDKASPPGDEFAANPKLRKAARSLIEGRVSWESVFVEAFSSSPLPERAAEMLRWIREIPRMRDAGVLTDLEAAEAAAELWGPFAMLAAAHVRESCGTPEDRLRRDLAAILAGGEAERILINGTSNSALGDARNLAEERPEREIPLEARSRALGWAVSRAEALVHDGWPAIQALAAALLEEEHLDGLAAHRIIREALGSDNGLGLRAGATVPPSVD